jgi:hypothetical protein
MDVDANCRALNSVAAPVIDGVQEAVHLGLRLPKAAVSGAVAVSVTDDFLVSPVLHIDLAGVKIYLEVDLSTSAGVSESVELVTSEALSIDVCRPPAHLQYRHISRAVADMF